MGGATMKVFARAQGDAVAEDLYDHDESVPSEDELSDEVTDDGSGV